jgi:hypothetical protein
MIGGRKLNAAKLLMSSGSWLWADSLTTGRKIRRNFMTYAFMLVQAVRYVTGSAVFELRSFVKVELRKIWNLRAARPQRRLQ